MNTFEVAEQGQEGVKKSTYSQFQFEAERLIKMKESYEFRIVSSDFTEVGVRNEMIGYSKIMMSELHPLLTDEEVVDLGRKIATLEMQSEAMSTLDVMPDTTYDMGAVIAAKAREFQNKCNEFLVMYNKSLQIHRLGIQVVKEKSETEKLYNTLEITPVFKNGFGIPISPEMEILCRALSVRAMQKMDNVVIIEGKPGRGKSTFAFALATTIADMLKSAFDVNYNFIFNETKEYCEEMIRKAPQFTPIVFDESGNQLNSKTFWDDAQVNFVNAINLIRFHGLSLIFCWADIHNIDKTVRDSRATLVVTINKRGRAIIRTFNENPHNRGLTSNSKWKHSVATNADQANKMLEFDRLKLLTVPFYEIPSSIWEPYEHRKETSNKITNLKNRDVTNADMLYREFLVKLVPNAVRIESWQLVKFAEEHNYYLSFKKLAQTIAKATGRQLNKVMVGTNPGDPTEGYIEIDPYINGYIERIRSQVRGAEEAPPAEGDAT